jgi:hypothetical protein
MRRIFFNGGKRNLNKKKIIKIQFIIIQLKIKINSKNKKANQFFAKRDRYRVLADKISSKNKNNK